MGHTSPTWNVKSSAWDETSPTSQTFQILISWWNFGLSVLLDYKFSLDPKSFASLGFASSSTIVWLLSQVKIPTIATFELYGLWYFTQWHDECAGIGNQNFWKPLSWKFMLWQTFWRPSHKIWITDPKKTSSEFQNQAWWQTFCYSPQFLGCPLLSSSLSMTLMVLIYVLLEMHLV